MAPAKSVTLMSIASYSLYNGRSYKDVFDVSLLVIFRLLIFLFLLVLLIVVVVVIVEVSVLVLGAMSDIYPRLICGEAKRNYMTLSFRANAA